MKVNKRVVGLTVLTVIVIVGTLLQIFVLGGNKMKELTEREYERAVQPIKNLQQVHGSRPFTGQEMKLLTETARDHQADFRLRTRALSALWLSKEPTQRRETIAIAESLLDDPDATVRAYAANALGVLEAHQYRNRLEALAQKDPDPNVRKVATIALSRLAQSQ